MQLRHNTIVARYYHIHTAFLQSALKAGQREYAAVGVDAANTGYPGQGVSGGADRPHVASVPVQSQSQSSR
jgi:hypothetical protein